MHIVLARSEEGYIAQEVIRRADEAVKPRLRQAEILHEHLCLVRVHLGYILLEFRRDGQHRRTLRLGKGGERLEICVVGIVRHAVLVEVGNVDHGLDGHKPAVNQYSAVIVAEVERAHGLLRLQVRDERLAHFRLVLILLVAALGVLPRALKPPFDYLNIRENHLKVERLRVALCVRLFKKNVVIVKAAHHVHQRVRLADRLKHLVALSASAHARHIDKLYRRGAVLLRVVVFRQPVQPLVGHSRVADIRLCARVGIGARLRLRAGQRVEKRRLAYIRQTHDTKLHIIYISYYHMCRIDYSRNRPVSQGGFYKILRAQSQLYITALLYVA